jgi:hypothetical protein
MGSEEDPYAFFLDLLKAAAGLQLLLAGGAFYATQLGLGGDAGDGFRVVAALFLGYGLRIFIKIEHLVGGGKQREVAGSGGGGGVVGCCGG